MRRELMVAAITGSISTSYSLPRARKILRSVLLYLGLFIKNSIPALKRMPLLHNGS
jgi:hypothetical protein